MRTIVRKWGNSAGVIIPAPVMQKMGLGMGDPLDIDVVDGQVTLTRRAYSLSSLLDNCPPDAMSLDSDDRDWLDASAKGREID